MTIEIVHYGYSPTESLLVDVTIDEPTLPEVHGHIVRGCFDVENKFIPMKEDDMEKYMDCSYTYNGS